MGVGFIQLLTVGNENKIFNYNPNISYFKIYYRRHTNFFINNMVINGNNININNILKKKIMFKIPLDGDLLTKSYIHLKFNSYYFELLDYNDELYSTLNNSIISLYNNFYIKTNNYSFDDIKLIQTVQIVYTNRTNMIIMSNITDNNEFMLLIKNEKFIKIQEDFLGIFYNIDLTNHFYSLQIDLTTNLKNNEIYNYLYNNINYINLNYINIDIPDINFSIRVIYYDKKFYELFVNTLYFNEYIGNIFQIRIDKNYVYYKCSYSINFFIKIIELAYIDVEKVELEVINNKHKSSNIIIQNDIVKKIILLIQNKNLNTVVYLQTFNCNPISQSQITIMENIIYFGNITNEYFNDLLISDSNKIMYIINVNNNNISLIVLTRIFISLFCYKDNVSIQEYLKIVNSGNLNYIKNFYFYQKNLEILQEKLIINFMNPDILIVSKKIFYIIIYTKNIYKNFSIDTYCQPFINKVISIYTELILNKYLFTSIILTLNNFFNDNTEDFNLKLMQLLSILNFFSSKFNKSTILTSNILKQNYIVNNFLFTPSELNNTFIDKNFIKIGDIYNIDNNFMIMFYMIVKNTLNLFIADSLSTICLVTNKLSSYIYETTGKLTSLFNDKKYSTCVLPLSSNIFVYTNNSYQSCNNLNSNNEYYFNKSLNMCLMQIKDNVLNYIYALFYKYRINIVNNLDFSLLNLVDFNNLTSEITDFYKTSINNIVELDLDNLNLFLNSINEIKYDIIYNYNNINQINLGNEIMYQLFNYVDSNLYNNTFGSYNFNKYSNCNSSIYNTNFKVELNYLKFIFSINSPLYRIYFLFTFLSKFTIDTIISNNNQSDINTLRDLILSFILNYFYYFNNYNIQNDYKSNQFTKFNLEIINNPIYILSNNFICCDQIDVINNLEFNKKLTEENSSEYMMIYNSFYFLQKKNNDLLLNLNNVNNIPNICNNFKYNFDDAIIILFLKVIQNNKNYFVKFDNLYDFVLIFLNKYNYDFQKMIASFLIIISNTNTIEYYLTILKNDFYKRCYSSTFMLGTLFDNTNNINITTINKINSLTVEYNSVSFNYEFSFKSYNIKKNINYLLIDNVINCFKFYQLSLFQIFSTRNKLSSEYGLNYLNSIIEFTNNNFVYFYLYIISEFNFIDSVNIINKNIILFNYINNSNVNLLFNDTTVKYSNVNFIKYNFIIIVYYYVYFIYKCMEADIISYNSKKSNNTMNFADFIGYKYSKNIYNECVNDIINVFNKSQNIISIDFSIYYYSESTNYENSNKYYSNIITISNTYSSLEYNYLNNHNEIINNSDRLTYNSINISSNININSVSNLTKNLIQISTYFNNYYNNLITNLTIKINNILLSMIIGNLYEKYEIVENFSNDTLSVNYIFIRDYYYNSSISILNLSIYKELSNAYNSNIILIQKNTMIGNKICNLILNTLSNFFSIDDKNYFNSIYYFSKLNNNIEYKNKNNEFINIEKSTCIENISVLNSINSLPYFYSKYINILIMNSVKYEKEINRIIYFLCTSYLIDISFDKNEMKKKVYSKTLYDTVKLYLNNENIKANKINKIYLKNTSIYSDQSVFQLFNYENLIDNISLSQNYWINKIIEKINVDIKEIDSYYEKFVKFTDYIKKYNLSFEIQYNLILNIGVSVFEYFKNIDNYDELCKLIYDYILLNDYFSPMYIFNNIVSLNESDNISSKLNIDTDYLKKKIAIFLFFNYIILSYIPELLINNIEINYNIVLEYTIDDIIYDIKLKDVLSIKKNVEIIKWSINEIYSLYIFEDSNLYNDNINLLQENQEILYIVRNSKYNFSPVQYYNLLFKKFISSYNLVIGNEQTNTDRLLNINFKDTYTNLVSNINIIFNNDINSINNSNTYDLTFYSLKILDIKLNSFICDLNNINYNKVYNTSIFTINSKYLYTRAQVNDFNLIYNLLCLLLNNYNVTYSNLINDVNIILNNLRLGSNPINDVLEYYKGYVSKIKMSMNLTSIDNIEKDQNYMDRIYIIQNLSKLVNELNNYSLITPNDYDDIIFTDFKYSYKNFFQKYYSFNYNYYNYKNNENNIFENLYYYYNKLSSNINAITSIKNYNLNLYVWMFTDLINSFIAIDFYNNKKEPYLYLYKLNDIINLYFKYNYKFRLNPNIKNTENLKIQYEYGKVEYKNTYTEMLLYLTKYYYYQLFSSTLSFNTLTYNNDYTIDLILFFETLNFSLNVNFNYNINFYNLVLKIEIIIRYLIYKINKIYNVVNTNSINAINLQSYEKSIIDLREKLINYFSDIYNILVFLNLKKTDDQKLNVINTILFTIINNSTNKNDFLKRFSMSVKKTIYWVNKYSYEQNSIIIWNEYFKNYNIEYYEYNDNQYKISNYSLTYDDFKYLIYIYLNFTILKNNGMTKFMDNEFVSIYNSLFSYIGHKNKTNIIEPYTVNKLLFLLNDDEIANLNYDENNNISSVFNNIIKLVLNQKWGTIVYENNNPQPNIIIKSCIFYFNCYFSYMNFLSNMQNTVNNSSFNFNYYDEIFYELYILYYLILITITCSYINYDYNYDLLNSMLTNANFTIELGNKQYCLDLTVNFSIYMDNINTNIIKNNNVSNYYKKIQNTCIYDNIQYGIPKFKENINNYDTYITTIFNQQINTLLFNNENSIGYNSFFNIIINTLNNYTSNIDYYIEGIKIVTNIYNTIFESLNKCIGKLQGFFGGNNYDGITLNEFNKNQLFDINNFKNENNQINMFTLIYKNFADGSIDNNILILMFYNICFIIWTTLGINIIEESNLFLKLFYMLANVINKKIIEFIELLSTNNDNQNNIKYIELNNFFNDMNILLFKNYSNNELIDVVKIFFQNIIYKYIYVTDSHTLDIYEFNQNINSKKNIFNNTEKYKIINWQYLIGLTIDYNNTNYTKNLKSIINVYTDEKIQDIMFNYIFDINGGLINKYGIIKIIENLNLFYDDENISVYTDNDYKIFLKKFQNINKQKLINDMLGINEFNNSDNIVNGIKPYIKFFKSKEYIIPIKFFFEKYFNSIPLISCMYSNISLSLSLKNTNILKNTYIYKNLTTCDIEAFLDLNYIILERDERKTLCKNKIDNLIERTIDHEIIKNIINLDTCVNKKFNQNIKLNFDFELNNLVKELNWTFDLYIDNYIINIVKDFKINQYSNIYNLAESITNLTNLTNSTNSTDLDFIVNTKFLIDGARRDGINSLDNNGNKNYNKITTLLNPYKYNTKASSYNNNNTYSFALEPTEFQPCGTFNMSNINIFTIQIEINVDKLLFYLSSLNILFNLNMVNLSMKLTTLEYNLIRYQSGLAGLLFIK